MTLKREKWRALRNFPVAWLNQSMTYMDRSELCFHLAINIFLFLVFFFLLKWTTSLQFLFLVVFSSISARTTNLVFNDHFCELVIFSFDSCRNGGRDRVAKYFIKSAKRLSKCKSIHACAIYGSIARNKFHEKSDLDIRYVRCPGFLTAIYALSFAVRERVIALFAWIPLDLYVGDSVNFLNKMRSDEIPVVIKDANGQMLTKYPTSVPLAKLLEDFSCNHFDSKTK